MPFFKRTRFEVRQSLSCLWGTAATPLGMPEATPSTPQALRGRFQPYSLFVRLRTLATLCSCQRHASASPFNPAPIGGGALQGPNSSIQVRTLNDFRPTAGKRRGAPPRPSCETTASTPAAAREAPKFSSALRAVAVVAVVECRYTYVAAQLSCRKKVHVARKNAPGRLESARRCVSKDVALQVWGRIRHTGRFSRFYAGQR